MISPHKQRQRGGLFLWALVILAGAAIGAFLVFRFVVANVQAQLVVSDEQLMAYVDQPLGVTASVLNELSISIDQSVSTRVPVDTVLSVPVDDPLNLVADFDANVPIRVNVPVNDVIPLVQDVYIDTVVEADLLGETFQLPLRGRFPVRAEVPISLVVPIDQDVHMKFTAPIQARLHQNLIVPLKTDIVATVPLKTQMTVPVLNDLEIQVTVPKEPRLAVTLNYADLILPLKNMGVDWVEQDAAKAEPAHEPKSELTSEASQ